MIFEENKIPYFQDHRFYRGIPTGIDFVCKLKQAILGDMPGGYLELTAPGYGINGNYGNGSLFLKVADLHDHIRRSAVMKKNSHCVSD